MASPSVVSRRFQLQLAKDAVDVGFDGLGAEKELLADRRVGAALGHQREDFLLPLGEVCQQVVRSPPGDQLGHNLGVDDRVSRGHRADRVVELVQIRDPVLEQVSDPLARPRQQLHRVLGLHVVREQQHTHCGVGASDLPGGLQSLRRLRWGHADVHDRHLGRRPPHQLEELLCSAGLPGHLEAGDRENVYQSLAKQERVVRHHHAHGGRQGE